MGVCVCVGFVVCWCVCGFCNLCVCGGFVICGYVCGGGFVMCGYVCVCVRLVVCGCVYVWVL